MDSTSEVNREADTPKLIAIERKALQVVEAHESRGGDGDQSHPSQDQAVEAGQRQEVLLLQSQDGVLPDHQDLQGRQRLKPPTVDGHQTVGVQMEPERSSRRYEEWGISYLTGTEMNRNFSGFHEINQLCHHKINVHNE